MLGKLRLQNLVQVSLKEDALAQNFKNISQYLLQQKTVIDYLRQDVELLFQKQKELDFMREQDKVSKLQRHIQSVQQKLDRLSLARSESHSWPAQSESIARQNSSELAQEMDRLLRRMQAYECSEGKGLKLLEQCHLRIQDQMQEARSQIQQDFAQKYESLLSLLSKAKNLGEIEERLIRMTKIQDEGLFAKVVALDSQVQGLLLRSQQSTARFADQVCALELRMSQAVERRFQEDPCPQDRANLNARLQELELQASAFAEWKLDLNRLQAEVSSLKQSALGKIDEAGGTEPADSKLLPGVIDSATLAALKDRVNQKLNKFSNQLAFLTKRSQFSEEREYVRERLRKLEQGLRRAEDGQRQSEARVLLRVDSIHLPVVKDFSNEIQTLFEQSNNRHSVLLKKLGQTNIRIDQLQSQASRSSQSVKPAEVVATQSPPPLNRVMVRDFVERVGERSKKVVENRLQVFRGEVLGLFQTVGTRISELERSTLDLRSSLDYLDEVKCILATKTDSGEFKKLAASLERQVRDIAQTLSPDDGKKGAVGKRAWMCLSCDRLISNFAAAPHQNWQGLPELPRKSRLSKSKKRQQSQHISNSLDC